MAAHLQGAALSRCCVVSYSVDAGKLQSELAEQFPQARDVPTQITRSLALWKQIAALAQSRKSVDPEANNAFEAVHWPE